MLESDKNYFKQDTNQLPLQNTMHFMVKYYIGWRTHTTDLSQILVIRYRKWQWIGLICKMHSTSIQMVAMIWTQTWKRNRGKLKETRRRSVEKEIKENNWTWIQVRRWTQARPTLKFLVTALCADQQEENKVSCLRLGYIQLLSRKLRSIAFRSRTSKCTFQIFRTNKYQTGERKKVYS